ncbi:AI-2E family transporter [Tardiphaga alba]|uniref:AI-2E family transporter n=1 Tax=Tardiphaga alba TaxID=340268 RepID=A0ABX8ACW8_9BRAD|nr:AI-2E family transporter [Tardiphaga alba]QUS40248.1 AI-2E family transporter [Tardiphaga alba]
MPLPADTNVPSRSDLAWAVSVGGVTTVAFTILVVFAWYFSATLFLIFAGILLGVALNALTQLLGRVMGGPQPLRLVLVCLLLASMLGGLLYLGGATIASQAKTLSGTLKSQVVNVKTYLEQHGVDTSYFDFNAILSDLPKDETKDTTATEIPGNIAPTTAPIPRTSNLPSAGTIASSGGAIVTQTLKILLGTVGAVGNFFIVLFLGLAFAAQPSVYRKGLLHLTPRKHREQATIIVDRISDTLQRWLIAQMITMVAVGSVTWLGLKLIGIPSSFILGVQAGLLAFIPTVGAILGGLIVVLASLASGWVAGASAFVLFMAVHALESYILTPILQRQALDIPPATLFAFQITLGVVFGVWGLALALPVMAIGKVVIDYLREDDDVPAQEAKA